ncbi:MAG: hypothetical protein CMN30_20925, partial [Sandaracinus sp.]|nr:hypothetical protein [Sandaracinus sp.]
MGAAIALVREHHQEYGEPQKEREEHEAPRKERDEHEAPRGATLDPARAHRALVTLAARRAADDVAMLEPLLVAHEGRIHEALGLGSFHEYCSRLFGWCG